MNDPLDVFGLNKARMLAWLAITIAALLLFSPLAWVFTSGIGFLWLRFDQKSAAVMLVERIFDFSK